MLDKILSNLPDGHPWKGSILYYPTVTSTNDVLKELAQQGAAHGTVLISGAQSKGRGRLGRSFQSPSSLGVYMSVLLRPECPPCELMHLTCASAVATCNAIAKAAGFRPRIKWTNDIVYGKRKLSGTLTELGLGKSQNVDYAIIGVGINCCQRPEDFPPEIRDIAGSLAMFSSREIDRAAVAAAMIETLFVMDSTLLRDKAAVLAQYRKDCLTIGQDVKVIKADSTRYGRALDIDDDGALVVAFSDGTVEAVSSGEISVRGLYNYI